MYGVCTSADPCDFSQFPQPSFEAPVWKPTLAFVLHTDGESTLVSQHQIDGQMTLAGGELVSPFELMRLTEQAVRSEEAKRGSHPNHSPALLPDNLLFQDANTLVWYEPARVRPMLFRLGSKRPARLMVPWPTLLFRVKKDSNSIEVLALKYKRRPTLTDQVFHAPLMNVYSDARMCQGTAILPAEKSVLTLSQMAETVFDSYFTHSNCDVFLKGFEKRDDEAAFSFWKALSDRGSKRFPSALLVPVIKNSWSQASVTVADFLNH